MTPSGPPAFAGRTLQVVASGSSGARVSIVERPDRSLVAVKVAEHPRVDAATQARSRHSIEPYLGDHLPDVIFAGACQGLDVLVTECPAIETLATSQLDDPRVQQIWRNAVRGLTGVWSSTASPGYASELATRNHERRVRRGVEGLRHTLVRLGLCRTTITVNDEPYSLDRWMGRLRDLTPPEIHVACQGDPQPQNILAAPDGSWYVVDWEWAGLHHDWRMLTSHLFGWWYVQGLLNGRGGRLVRARDGAAITYGPVALPPQSAMSAAVDTFLDFTRPGRRDSDLSALAVHTALLLLRELPRHTGDPQIAAVLLGEFLTVLASADRPETHPLMRPFQRSGAVA